MQIGNIVTINGIGFIGRIIAVKHARAWIVEWEDGDTTWEMEIDLLSIEPPKDCQSDIFCP
jgi:hypothetical protein